MSVPRAAAAEAAVSAAVIRSLAGRLGAVWGVVERITAIARWSSSSVVRRGARAKGGVAYGVVRTGRDGGFR
ncbi:hypothetical protein AB0I10_07400 [Streptomyces sp. NPDC050636]|uniref:hypothetical protein n=1 Tax=Streptomyces sp. NPDC050636 TaxID=3154510 RepID=UPI00344AFCF4